MPESLKLVAVASFSAVLVAVVGGPGRTATLLRGYVSQTHEQPSARPGSRSSKPELSGDASIGSFPTTYEGIWHCLTVVVDSSLESVPKGQQMESEIEFRRFPDGRVVARWNQPGWVESQAAVTAWSSSESQIDRTDYYYSDSINGSWAARSRDRFTQVAPDKMTSQSYIDQYLDGQFLGRYRTQSTLVRKSNDKNIASTPVSNGD